MGTSTDAILFYGVLLGDEDTEWDQPAWWTEADDEFPEWEKQYAKLHGVTYVWDEATEESNYDDVLKKAHESLCEVDYHCSSEYPMYYVGVKASEVSANRGYPQRLDGHPASMIGLQWDLWDEQLKQFCEEMELPYDNPGWYLVSIWMH
jgi:hypothetical protein